MSTETAILEAFFTKLNAAALGDADGPYPIGWPGVEFKRPGGGIWLEVRAFPSDVLNLHLDADAPSLHTGAFRVQVASRPGGGIMQLSAVADSVVAEFAKGSPLGPVTVQERASVAGAVFTKDRQFIPVTVRYRGIF